MREEAVVVETAEIAQRDSWKAMTIIGLGQALLTFNVSALPISMSGIVSSFHIVPTTVGTVIVVHSLCVAAFVMLGAKLGQIYGSRNVFQVMNAVYAIAMVMMAFAPNISVVLVSQAIAGVAASALVPTLVVLIANNYKGRQQGQALGLLGGVQALAGMLAFFVAGALETLVSWRYTFAILIPWSIAMFFLGRQLKPVKKVPGIRIDFLGVLLAASSIILISLGFNSLNDWGLFLAKPAALFHLGGLSPAPVMIILGFVLIQSFFAWSQRRIVDGKTPLLALQVVETSQAQIAVLAMLAIVLLGKALTFLMPLYIEIIQGRSSFQTAVYLIPYQLSVFAAAVFVVRLYGRFSPQEIARYSFVIVAIGFAGLGMKFQNDWNDVLVILFLVVIGIGQGALVTLLFNVLVTSSRKKFAGDVGSLRGTASNLASAVGTAIAGSLMVGILSVNVERSLKDHPTLPHTLIQKVDLNNVTFISNDHLIEALIPTSATPADIKEALRINADARLQAMRLSLFFLAGLAFVVIIPTRGLPKQVVGYAPPEHPDANDDDD
jgi:MFS family permease